MTIESRWKRWLFLVAGVLVGGGVVYLLLPHVDHIKANPYESSAVARLRTIAERQDEFRTTHNGGYAETFDQLQIGPSDGHYAYSLAIAAKNGQGQVTKYTAEASPAAPEKAGLRYFSIDETKTVRFDTHPVDAASPPLVQ